MLTHFLVARPRDQTIHEELAAFADDDVVEMTNLQEKDTGIAGVVFISTVMGLHGPRVKYFAKADDSQPRFSVSIANEPEVVASSVSQRELNRAAPAVKRWVKLNKEALLRFWIEGKSMSVDELYDFAKSLKKL